MSDENELLRQQFEISMNEWHVWCSPASRNLITCDCGRNQHLYRLAQQLGISDEELRRLDGRETSN